MKKRLTMFYKSFLFYIPLINKKRVSITRELFLIDSFENYSLTTFAAVSPRSLFATSNSTLSPSSSDLNPSV